MFLILLLTLLGCSNAAKDSTQNKTSQPPSVTVNLPNDLQMAIGLDSGQLQLLLTLDNDAPQAIPLSSQTLNLPDLGEESHTFTVRAFYTLSINTNTPHSRQAKE